MQLNFKKTLALALSAAMVLTAAPMAGINANAAAKVALSAKKGTIQVKKTKKVKIKNTKKANIKKVTFKYSKKNIAKATWKKATANKIAIKGLKAGKTKITATIKLKNKVAGKKTYKLTYTATVKKAADTKVAVTGVTLSNSTPKVGDTITANIDPSNATGVTYQWLADNAVIAGATQATYTVAETDLGKALSVTATDDQGNSVKSTETAKVEAKEAAEIAVEAKQTKAKEITVTYTKGSHSADNKYVVTKGSAELKVASSVANAETGAVVLTMSENLSDGDYTLKVTTTAGKTAEATFKGEKPVLKEVKFTNDQLSVSANTTEGMKKGYAHIESYDQFNQHMNLTSPSFTVSKGDYSFKSDTGVLTLDASNTDAGTYTLGEKVVVTVTYDNNTKVLPATLTVTTAAMATTLTFDEKIASDDAKLYPVDHITQSNLARGVYFFKVTEAKDDSKIDLDAERLNDMLEANTLYITPNTADGTIIYANEFTEKTIDGKKTIVLVVKGGGQLKGLNAGVDMPLSVFSIGGASAQLPVRIERDAVIKTLNIEIPDLYMGRTSEIKLSATDTDGNAVDLYKVTSNMSLAAASNTAVNAGTVLLENVTSGELRFWDTAQGVNVVGTKVNLSTGNISSDWELVRNATDHSVSLKVTPKTGDDGKGGYLNMTGTTAGYDAIAKNNIKINPTATVDGITGFQGVAQNVLTSYTTAQSLIGGNLVLSKNDGSTTNAAAAGAIYAVDADNKLDGSSSAVDAITVDGTPYASVTNDVLYYTVVINGKKIEETTQTGNAFVLNRTAGTIAVRNTDTGKSDTVKVSLYKLSKIDKPSGDKDIKVERLATKSFTFTVENENTAEYVINVGEDKVLYAGTQNTGNDALPISITTKMGSAVPQSKLQSVKVVNTNNDNALFDYQGGSIVCTTPSIKDPGTKMTATINAVVQNDKDVRDVSATFTYVTDQPVVKYTGVFSNAGMTNAVAGNRVSVNDSLIGAGNAGVWLKYFDQYYTQADQDGVDVGVTIMNYTGAAQKLTGTFVDGLLALQTTSTPQVIKSGETFNVVINGGIGLTLYCTASADITVPTKPAGGVISAVTTEAQFVAAGASVIVGGNVTLDGTNYNFDSNTDSVDDQYKVTDLTINKGKTLTIPAGVVLNITGDLMNNGTITGEGTVVLTGDLAGTGVINMTANNTFVFGGANKILGEQTIKGYVGLQGNVTVDGKLTITDGTTITAESAGTETITVGTVEGAEIVIPAKATITVVNGTTGAESVITNGSATKAIDASTIDATAITAENNSDQKNFSTVTITAAVVKTDAKKAEYNDGDLYDPTGLVLTVTDSTGAETEVKYAGNESDFVFKHNGGAEIEDSDPLTYAADNGKAVDIVYKGIAVTGNGNLTIAKSAIAKSVVIMNLENKTPQVKVTGLKAQGTIYVVPSDTTITNEASLQAVDVANKDTSAITSGPITEVITLDAADAVNPAKQYVAVLVEKTNFTTNYDLVKSEAVKPAEAVASDVAGTPAAGKGKVSTKDTAGVVSVTGLTVVDQYGNTYTKAGSASVTVTYKDGATTLKEGATATFTWNASGEVTCKFTLGGAAVNETAAIKPFSEGKTIKVTATVQAEAWSGDAEADGDSTWTVSRRSTHQHPKPRNRPLLTRYRGICGKGGKRTAYAILYLVLAL